MMNGMTSDTLLSAPSSPLAQTFKYSGVEHTHSSESRSPSPELPPPSPVPSDLGQSPSASTFLRTAATLEGLAQQLSTLSVDEDDEVGGGNEECCGAGCEAVKAARERMAEKLILSGEIGNALLQRYEALEKKHSFEVERLNLQLDVKRTALAESLRRVNALEKANGTHLAKYAEITRKYEALEKRYTQSLHTQTLTQQSLTHVRTELTTLRTTMQRQSIALVTGVGVEDRLLDAERRYEEARELQITAERTAREETRKRTRAEMRISELEEQLRASQHEIEDIKESRTKDAQLVLDNAKSRLETLHQELSETFRADSPSEQPEYLRAMEGLVASNAMLKHDASELSHVLAESKDEIRQLRDEVEELRAVAGIGAVGRISPSVPPHLAAELRGSFAHNRTESTPNVIAGGSGGHDRGTWARMSVSSSTRWDHNRRSSFAPSFASTSTTDGLTSPGLGLGSIGEFGGALMRDGALSPPPPTDGRESPSQGQFRTSPSGGIGYVLNGVPKMGTVKPQFRRRASDKPRMPSRNYTSQGVGSIAESAPFESDIGHTTDEPLSPASEYFRAADVSRKRRSLMLHRYHSSSPHESADYSLTGTASQTLVDPGTDMISPRSEGDIDTAGTATQGMSKPSPAKAAHRRTLLLLTKNKGTQTDPDPTDLGGETVRIASSEKVDMAPSLASNGTSPRVEDQSETSSLHPPNSGPLLSVVDHLSKLLARLRAADIPTLNKRLKKQHLPGDVSHLSRSTLRGLHAEIGETKHLFRGLLDSTGIQRKEWNVLFKLLKDLFTELVDMQAVINDVTLEPKLAKRLQKEAFRDEEAEEAALAAAAGGGVGAGLGWIANPITRLFVTPAAEPVADHKVGRVERGKLQAGPPAKSAPKQAAIAGATTTHVSVEFGGAGIVRRATPAGAPNTAAGAGSGVVDALPPSPNPMTTSNPGSRQVSSTSTATLASTTVPNDHLGTTRTLRPPGTLRPSKSRANRDELLGIFAGAQRPIMPTGGQPWVVIDPNQPVPGPSKLRNTTSQHFGPNGERTVRARDDIQRKRLSAVVDAVIDTEQINDLNRPHDVDEGHDQSFQPLLARTLRPRGLSDSSIRSTFVSHSATSADALPDLSGPAARQGGYAGGFMAGLGRRLYWNTKAEVSPINPIDAPPPPPPVSNRTVSTSSIEPKPLVKSTSKPISVSASPNKRDTTTIQSVTGTSTGETGGFFGRLLASSIAADSMKLVDDSEDNIGGRSLGSRGGAGAGMMDSVEREEMMGASLRQGVVMGRNASRAGTRWD